MKRMLFFTLLLFLVAPANAEIKVDYYYQVGCGACAVFEKTLDEILDEGMYDLNVSRYEVRYDSNNFQKLNDTYGRLGIPPDRWGTPTIVLNDSMLFIRAFDKEEFESVLDRCIEGECNPGGNNGNGHINAIDVTNPVTVFFAGLVSGFNPCLIAVLLFLMSYSLGVSENKSRLIRLTFAFSMGIFTAYFLIGWGLLSFAASMDIGAVSNGIAIVVIVLGLWTVKDYRNPKSFLVETPENVKGMSESLTKKGSMVTAFVLGGIFSLVKAPCVGGIYLAILNMASSADIGTKISSAPLLLSYNLGLVSPLLLITIAVLLGVPPDAIERWRERNKYLLRVLVGLTLVVVGLVMLWQQGTI